MRYLHSSHRKKNNLHNDYALPEFPVLHKLLKNKRSTYIPLLEKSDKNYKK